MHLVSVDPAHSLGDVLDTALGDDERGVAGAPPELRAREVDAAAIWDRLRQRLRAEIAAALSWGGERAGADVPLEHEILERLLAAAPPGLDELVALEALAPPAGGELRVVDTAPTGHALRLLELPEVALAWDHALMEILLAHREVVRPGELGRELVELSRRLRRLRDLLRDPERCRFVVVERAGELPRRESERLLAALAGLGVRVAARVVDAVPPGGPAGGPAAAAPRATGGDGCAILHAPAAFPPPRGATALARWVRSWTVRGGDSPSSV